MPRTFIYRSHWPLRRSDLRRARRRLVKIFPTPRTLMSALCIRILRLDLSCAHSCPTLLIHRYHQQSMLSWVSFPGLEHIALKLRITMSLGVGGTHTPLRQRQTDLWVWGLGSCVLSFLRESRCLCTTIWKDEMGVWNGQHPGSVWERISWG